MKVSQIAAQLYTVRDFCQTAAAFADTVQKIRAIGYEAVELSGIGDIPEKELVRITSGEGLTICATHEPGPVLLDDTEKAIARLQELGCRLTAYPYPTGVDFGDEPSLSAWVRKLDLAGGKLRAAGMTLSYHHHDMEFWKVGDVTVLEYIFDHSDPRHLSAELDTYWVQHGGGDPVEWCRKLRGRLPSIHLKDYAMTLEGTPAYAEIGRGTLPFRRIVEEAEHSGCRWFIVEQDTCPGDPFASLRTSFEYLTANLTA